MKWGCGVGWLEVHCKGRRKNGPWGCMLSELRFIRRKKKQIWHYCMLAGCALGCILKEGKTETGKFGRRCIEVHFKSRKNRVVVKLLARGAVKQCDSV